MQRSPSLSTLLPAAALWIAAAACATGGERPEPGALDLPGFRILAPSVAGGGQPALEELAELAELGYGLVINLRRPSEPLAAEEGDLVRAAGLDYVAIPLGSADLTADHARHLAELLRERATGHVLLHCASGNRVGALWGLHIGLRDGLGIAETLEVARASGMQSPALAGCVREALMSAGGRP
jgi:uncharacterized protein (TIGR01244 family)